MFVKKPDPHDEAMEILKDQMANPPKPVQTLIVLNIYTPMITRRLKDHHYFCISECKEAILL